jgi:gluconate 2-dehydrogenase gamma chain
MAVDQLRIFTRRDLLKGVGLAGAAAATSAVGVGVLAGGGHASLTAEAAAAGVAAQTAARRQAYEQLTAQEADLLEAFVARLIPNDASGPGAIECGATYYIDRGLGGALAGSREAYRAGLAALDRYARAVRGVGFLELSDRDKDAVLTDIESGTTTPEIFTGSSAQFFGLVLAHTRQGMFGDPFYGGNANFAGWDLIGYPGVRTMVTAADQKALEANQLKPNHKSAYDSETFIKATVRAEPHEDTTAGGDRHGE